MTAKVFLALDNRVLRESLCRLLRSNAKGAIEVCGNSPCSPELPEAIVAASPDVLITETVPSLAPDGGFLGSMLCCSTTIKVLIVDLKDDEQSFFDAVRRGATGFLLRDCSAADVLTAVRSLSRGEPFCPPRLCAKLLSYVARDHVTPPSIEVRLRLGLTRRQQQIAPLLAKGLTNKEIASQLNLSEQTVKNHVHSMLRRTGARDRLGVADQVRQTAYESRFGIGESQLSRE